ncbi:MAG TPA: hypothetical protein QF509_05640 [Rhodospirillales bacterium]|jgi:hypothetical protein|nr:hypothetical protein [Rhodospirillales bacterium]
MMEWKTGLTAAAVLICFTLLTSTASHAGGVCDMASLLAEYKTALERHHLYCRNRDIWIFAMRKKPFWSAGKTKAC